MAENIDKTELENAIKYFKSIIFSNISKCSQYKMGATFIGIKTNITGSYKLHIYIILFPFIKNQSIVPYCYNFSNIYLKDVCFDVDETFYLWAYDEMKKQESIIIMSLESYVLKVVSGCDLLICIDKNCNEKKEWMELEYKDWYTKNLFNNVFTITITNPYLYMVPFPVSPIIIKTIHNTNFIKLI
jgi:hypothetical protein